jgi:hypothetical protein
LSHRRVRKIVRSVVGDEMCIDQSEIKKRHSTEAAILMPRRDRVAAHPPDRRSGAARFGTRRAEVHTAMRMALAEEGWLAE